jgi:hypothetical protein
MSTLAGDTLIEDNSTTLAVGINGDEAIVLETEGLILTTTSNGTTSLIVAGNGDVHD